MKIIIMKKNFKLHTSNFTLILILLFLVSCGSDNGNSVKEEAVVHKPTFLYGICIDSLDVAEGSFKKN